MVVKKMSSLGGPPFKKLPLFPNIYLQCEGDWDTKLNRERERGKKGKGFSGEKKEKDKTWMFSVSIKFANRTESFARKPSLCQIF